MCLFDRQWTTEYSNYFLFSIWCITVHVWLVGSVTLSLTLLELKNSENFPKTQIKFCVNFGDRFVKIIKNNTLLMYNFNKFFQDLRSIVSKVSDFLGRTLNENQTDQLLDHLSFESMKKNPAINSDYLNSFVSRFNISKESGEFVRSGKVGEWRTSMKPELQDRFQNWITKNSKTVGISLDHWNYQQFLKFSENIIESF